MHSRIKASIYTFIIYVFNSILTIVFGLLYSNYLIRIYGTEVNGLVSTLNQFVSLFTIIEGGFTTAAIISAYEPIINKNYDELNHVLYTTKKIYNYIGVTITFLVLVFGSLYIRFIDSPFSYWNTFLLLVISASSTGLSICFLSKSSVLLQGDNKEYIQVYGSLMSRVITWIIAIILMIKNAQIILVFAMNLINVLVNVCFIKLYEIKNYSYINYSGKFNKDYIKGTGDVLFQKIANTVFTSTDLILISVCVGLSYSSVYNLYCQIFKAILSLISSMTQAPFNSFGHLYKIPERREVFKEYFSIYQYIILVSSTIVLSITGVLIIPFVKLYSANITDFNYVYPSLAILFYSQIFAQIINRPYGTILNATGNFKMQNFQCGLAVVINIFVSIAFIQQLGMNSIILGSFIGTMVILIMNIIQAYRNVLEEKTTRIWIDIGINYFLGVLIMVASFIIDINVNSYIDFILQGIFWTLLIFCGVFFLNLIIDNKRMILTLSFCRKLIIRKK